MENDIYIRIILSIILGSLIGLERELKRETSRTYNLTLVSLGATYDCYFTRKYFKNRGYNKT